MENKYVRKYLEENSLFDIKDNTGIAGNPLITVKRRNEIIFHSDPKDFNIKYLKYRLGNQEYAYRNSTTLYGKIQYESCIEILEILDKLERKLKIEQINGI